MCVPITSCDRAVQYRDGRVTVDYRRRVHGEGKTLRTLPSDPDRASFSFMALE
jgi:hypothetical protein